MSATSPSPKPAWWLPLCRYRYGLGPRPSTAPKPSPKWCAEQWAKFESWSAWKDAGSHGPRQGWPAGAPKWAIQLRAELIAAHKKPPPPPPPAPDHVGLDSDLLLGPGIYMYSAANTEFGADGFASRCADSGIAWVALLVHEGLTPTNAVKNPPGFMDALVRHGIAPVAWGSVFGNPILEAEVAADESVGFERYIVDAEQDWNYFDAQGHVDTTGQFTRADAFALTFSKNSKLTGAVSTVCGCQVHFKPLFDVGFQVIHPQTYMNQYPWLTPQFGIDKSYDSVQADFPGWKRASTGPTVASYGSFRDPLATYEPLLVAAGCAKRWSYYSGEFLTEADFAVAKRLIKG